MSSALSGSFRPRACADTSSFGGIDLGAPRKLTSVSCSLRGDNRREGMLPRGSWAGTWEQAFLVSQPRVAFTSVSGTLPRPGPPLCLLVQEPISNKTGLFQVYMGARVHGT